MFTISSRHSATWDAMSQYFTFTPNSKDLRALEADMRTLNPTVLRDAITECIAVNKQNRIHYLSQRSFIHNAYNRRIKEFAAVYPFIFTLENALRSHLADHMEKLTNRMDWWVIIRDAVVDGGDPSIFSAANNPEKAFIRGLEVPPQFVAYLFKIMKDLLDNKDTASQIMGQSRSDEFYYAITLGELWRLIDKGWSFCREMFCPDAELNAPFTRKIFNDELRVIKEARNNLYHSKPITNRTKMIECVEKILNCLNFHLADYDACLALAQYTRPTARVQREKRHLLPG